MEILSMNELYAWDGMFYWCNAAGDINLPGDSRKSGLIVYHESDELPQKARDLYEHYWTECGSTMEYVIQLSGHTGYAFAFLFDDDWLEELSVQREHFRKIARYIIEEKLNAPAFSNCIMIYGEDTDPDGDEYMICVLYENAEDIRNIRNVLTENDLYKSIEHAVRCLS